MTDVQTRARQVIARTDGPRLLPLGAGIADAILAALADEGLVIEQGWQTIDSAPRDGTEIWAWNGENAVMLWESGNMWPGWLYADVLLNDVQPDPDPPTHWRPLPAPPEPTP